MTEQDGRDPVPASVGGLAARLRAEQAALAFSSNGVRSSAVRIAPTCHGEGDNGFMAFLVNIARATGVSGYLGDGDNRWPAVHRLDTAHLFRLSLEKAPARIGPARCGRRGRANPRPGGSDRKSLDLPVSASG